MSTYAVVKKDGEVFIGTDSITMFGNLSTSRFHRTTSKVISVNDIHFLCSGVDSMEFRIKIFFSDVNIKEFESRESVFLLFEKFYNYLADECHLKPVLNDDSEFAEWDLVFLVAAGSKVYTIYQTREVLEHENFWAIGSGEDYCLGAMTALYDIDGMSAEAILRGGIAAAIDLDISSYAPVHLIKVKP